MSGAETREDVFTPALAARYAATFDRPARATGVQGIHWCLNTPEAATAGLGADGHPLRAEYPDLPRRMWAASDVRFLAPIPVGATVRRATRVLETTEKQGRSGRLVFVEIGHEISADGVPAVSERQSIVYRPAPPPGGTAPSAPAPATPVDLAAWDWQRELCPQPPLLFRYSALTFNSHRIHYDQPYATGVEGYPGLVVHGPLMAALLLDLADRELGPDALASFRFRASTPAFAGAPLVLLGRVRDGAVDLAVTTAAGAPVMTASGALA